MICLVLESSGIVSDLVLPVEKRRGFDNLYGSIAVILE